MEPVNIDFIIGGNVDSEGKKVEDQFSKIGTSAKAAKAEIQIQIREQKLLVKELENDLKAAEKTFAKMGAGKEKMALEKQVTGLREYTNQERQRLVELQNDLDKTGAAYERISAKMTQAKDTLAKLDSEGLRGSELWNAASRELEEYAAQMKSVQMRTQALSDPNAGLKAAAGGVAALSGALTAGIGVASLFGVEQEKLAQIQTRLQAAMAITIGLQQVAEKLNKDNYFSVVLLTKAKGLWAAANLRVATTLGITSAASRALMLTGIGVLIAGVTALIAVYAKWRKEQNEKNKALEKERHAQAETAKEIADGYGKEIAKIEALRASLNSENISRSKKLDIVRRLKEQIPGYTAELDREGNVIRENKKAIDDYMLSLEKSLKLRAAEKELEALYSKKYGVERKYGNAITVFESGLPNMPKEAQNELRNTYRGQYYTAKSELDTINKDIEAVKSHIINDGLIDLVTQTKDAASKITKEQYDAAKALQKQIIDIQAQTSKLELDLMRDGLDKRLKEVDEEKAAEIAKIEEKEQAIIEAYNKAHQDEKGFTAATTLAEAGLSAEDIARLEEEKTKLLSAYEAKRADVIRQYSEETLKLAGEHAERRIKIETDFNEKIEELNKRSAELQQLALSTENPVLKFIYEAQAKAAKEAAEAAKTERDKQVSDATIALIKEGDAYQQLTDRKLRLSKELTKKLLAEITQQLNAEIAAGKAITADVQKFIDAISNASEKNKKINFADYADGALKAADAISWLAEKLNELAEITGNTELESAAGQMSAVAQNFGAAAEGFKSGGWIGAIVGGVTDIISQTVNGWLEIKRQEEEAKQAALDYENAITLIGLTFEKYDNIFGGTGIADAANAYAKATEAAEKYNEAVNASLELGATEYAKKNQGLGLVLGLLTGDAISTVAGVGTGLGKEVTNQFKAVQEAYKKGYTALQGMAVKTRDYNGWQEFWGKKDQYTSLKDLAPNLWDENGDFNLENAKAFLETNTQLTDEQRKQIQNVIDLQEKYDEAMEVVRQEIESTFGYLGQEFTDSIVEGIKSGADAWTIFKDAGSDAIEVLGEQLIYQLFAAARFEKLAEDLKDTYDLGDSAAIAQAQMDLLSGYFDGVTQDMENAGKFAQWWKDEAAKRGFEIWNNDDKNKDKSGIKGDAAKMSEETGSELVGQIAAMRLNVATALATGKSTLDMVSRVLAVLEDIRDNTAYCRRLDRIDETLVYLKNNGIKVA